MAGDEEMGVAKDKSRLFAIRIVKLYRYLREGKKSLFFSSSF